MKIISRSEEALEIALFEKIYTKEVLLKSTYWLLGRYLIDLMWRDSDSCFIMLIRPKQESFSPAEIDKLIEKIRIDLIDYATRQIVANETMHIRTILLAKAFASEDL